VLCASARIVGGNFEYVEGAIDPPILPLVQAMNHSGLMRTFNSCAGHVGMEFAPYVSFECSVETAARFSELLRSTYRSPKSPLKTKWIVAGVFREQRGLTFRVFSPAYDASAESLLRSLIRFGLRRHTVDADIQVIAKVVQDDLPAVWTVNPN
jgi:hypothetical protein